MLQSVKSLIPRSLKTAYRKRKESVALASWRRAGSPVPPPHIAKQLTIREAQNRYGCDILVETGTYMGDMVEAQRDNFAYVYSIELSPTLYTRAVKRFSSDANVEILQGDSGEVLVTLVPRILKPAIFWLDGHYSGGVTAKGKLTSPIMAEIETILSARVKGHAILIDDARLFVGDEDYPTVRAVEDRVSTLAPTYAVDVKNDIIRCLPTS